MNSIFKNFGIKKIVFLLLIILIAIYFWGILILFFLNASLNFLILLIIGWIAFLLMILLSVFLIDNRKLIYGVFIISVMGFFLFYNNLVNHNFFYYLLGVLGFLLFLIIGLELMFLEKKDRLKISFKRTWKRGLPWIITSFALIISLVYYFNPLLKINQEEIIIPQEFFGVILKPASRLMGKTISFYDPEMTIDETLASNIILQNKEEVDIEKIPAELVNKINSNNLKDLDINDLLKNPAIKDFLQSQLIQDTFNQRLILEQREQLSQSLGVELTGNETTEDVLANLVNSKINEFIGPNVKEISIGIAIALFLILRFLGKILALFAYLLAKIIFDILVLFKIVKIKKEKKIGENVYF